MTSLFCVYLRWSSNSVLVFNSSSGQRQIDRGFALKQNKIYLNVHQLLHIYFAHTAYTCNAAQQIGRLKMQD